MFLGGKVMSSVGALLAVFLAVQPASAEPPSLRDFLFGAARPGDNLPTVAHYKSDGGQDFVFDHGSGHMALMKFDDAGEVWALTATPGPRGDIIYKNDTGQPVLRATRLGGLTLFTASSPGGVAAAPAGIAAIPRTPSVLGPEALWSIQVQASARASRAVRHLIFFDAIDAAVTPASESVFADAFTLTADAILQVADQGHSGLLTAARVFKVRFIQGKSADAILVGPLMQITVAPQMGVAGRPSSRRIAAAILRR
jgi:hypothetical protein